MTAKKNNPTIHPFGNTQQKRFISVLYLKKKKKKTGREFPGGTAG